VSAAVPKSSAVRKSEILTTTSIVSFSLTLLAGGAAVLAGLVPLGPLTFGQRVDVGTLLFVSPLVALVLAVVFEVTRIALTSSKLPEPRRQQSLRWSPGRREG
jgi:hypothetical protein